ncbi:hypothetical protein WA026_013225 [Henosepilachna vigintioctopunctata]|uniref:Uncharacterized protein n=1 Tax=Henosepilachna vigintioctopunctata TaxID=420089 RepID=A0AAW1UD09_9CUCU
MRVNTLWCSLIIFEVWLLITVASAAPKSDKIHLTDGIDIGGIWKTKMHWKAHWVKHWEARQMWVPIWRKIWTPVEMKEWVPLPPPAKSRHWNMPSY